MSDDRKITPAGKFLLAITLIPGFIIVSPLLGFALWTAPWFTIPVLLVAGFGIRKMWRKPAVWPTPQEQSRLRSEANDSPQWRIGGYGPNLIGGGLAGFVLANSLDDDDEMI